ncbi:PEP/pyruvate-binding domain-containing protein [Streptomyces sp. NPDC053431]|uniref:PEP/pyruvate-binding domain-containing protein n=1 Tax=Streptomyces sp. NPDC053431 TaxID=3365703 RepID=UPI0037CDA0EA
MDFVLPLDAAAATLETAGGKGAALAELARGGLPVPGGFHVTTAAYQEFVTSTGVAERIRAELGAASEADAASDTGAAARIRAYFEEGPLPSALEEAAGRWRSWSLRARHPSRSDPGRCLDEPQRTNG